MKSLRQRWRAGALVVVFGVVALLAVIRWIAAPPEQQWQDEAARSRLARSQAAYRPERATTIREEIARFSGSSPLRAGRLVASSGGGSPDDASDTGVDHGGAQESVLDTRPESELRGLSLASRALLMPQLFLCYAEALKSEPSLQGDFSLMVRLRGRGDGELVVTEVRRAPGPTLEVKQAVRRSLIEADERRRARPWLDDGRGPTLDEVLAALDSDVPPGHPLEDCVEAAFLGMVLETSIKVPIDEFMTDGYTLSPYELRQVLPPPP